MSKLNKFEDVDVYRFPRSDYEAEYRLFTRSDFDLDRNIIAESGGKPHSNEDKAPLMVFPPVRDAAASGSATFS